MKEKGKSRQAKDTVYSTTTDTSDSEDNDEVTSIQQLVQRKRKTQKGKETIELTTSSDELPLRRAIQARHQEQLPQPPQAQLCRTHEEVEQVPALPVYEEVQGGQNNPVWEEQLEPQQETQQPEQDQQHQTHEQVEVVPDLPVYKEVQERQVNPTWRNSCNHPRRVSIWSKTKCNRRGVGVQEITVA